MNEGKTIVVGFGEIGKAVKETICPDALVYDISMSERPGAITPTDVMHICFPYSDNFVHDAQAYITIWQPKHIAIWSTLPIGTTRQVDSRAVHTPVTGKHPNLADSIRKTRRWIGANDRKEEDFFVDYFDKRGLGYQTVGNSDYTEALKLLCTTEYGINIEFARYKKRVADAIGMRFELTKLWNSDYNDLYHSLGMDWAQKYILDAPDGPKGGHCVTPNARILQGQYPDDLVKRVAELE